MRIGTIGDIKKRLTAENGSDYPELFFVRRK